MEQVKTFKKTGIWLACIFLVGICVYEGISRYALYKAPPEIAFSQNKRTYAREYLFGKIHPSGGLYEDDYYRFRLLKGSKFVLLPNGYRFDIPSGRIFELHEFASWNAYLEYYSGLTMFTKRHNQGSAVVGKVPFSILPEELYGRILPDSIAGIALLSGETGIMFVSGGHYGHYGREVLILKKSGHVINISQMSIDGHIDRVNHAALKLLLGSLECKKDMSVENVTKAMVLAYEREYLLPESKERKPWLTVKD